MDILNMTMDKSQFIHDFPHPFTWYPSNLMVWVLNHELGVFLEKMWSFLCSWELSLLTRSVDGMSNMLLVSSVKNG